MCVSSLASPELTNRLTNVCAYFSIFFRMYVCVCVFFLH